tara:strand:- start:3377 stop:3496 length:120 start_codon:yes stop_codon:yes gene_type:complete
MTTQTATPFLSFRGGTLGALTPLILLRRSKQNAAEITAV